MAASPPRGPLGGRILAGCGAVGLIGLIAGVVVGVGTWVYLRTDAGQELMRARIEAILEDATPYGSVTIGRLRTDLWGVLELYEVRITDEEGDTVVWVERALADVSLGAITRRVIRLPKLRLDGVLLDLEERDDGILNLARVFGQVEPGDPDAPWAGLPIRLDLPDLEIRGLHARYSTATGEVLRLVGADATASVAGRETIRVADIDLIGLLAEPGPVAVRATGALTYTGDGVDLHDILLAPPRSRIGVDGRMDDRWDLTLDLQRLHLPDIDPIAGDPGLGGTFTGRVTLQGPSDAPRLQGPLRGIDGTVGAVGLNLLLGLGEDPLRISGRADLEDLHVHHVYPALDEEVVIDGGANLDVLVGAYPEDLVVDIRFQGGRQRAFGQTLDALSGHFRIERGILRIRDTRAVGIVGELFVTGDIDLERGPMDLRVTGTAEPGRLAALGVEGLGTTGRLDVRIRGDIQRPGAPIRADGTVSWAPFRYDGGQLALSEVRARFDATIADQQVRGVANVTAGGGEAYGVQLDGATATDVRFVVPLERGTTTITGDIVADGVRMPDLFWISTTRGDFAVTVPPVGDPEVRVGLALEEHDVLGFPGTAGTVAATIVGDDVTYRVDLYQDERQMLLADGTFHLGTQQVVLDELLVSLTPRATWEAVRTVRFRLTDYGIADADIAIAGNLGAFELTGTVGQRGPLDAELVVSGLQLDTFAELFPEQVEGLYGVLDLQVTMLGTGASPRIDGTIDVRSLWVEDAVRWLDVTGTFQADRDTFRPQLRVGVAGRPMAVVWGDIPVSLDLMDPRIAPGGPLALEVAIQPGGLDRFELAFIAVEAGSLPVGLLSAVLQATGTLGDPDFRLAGVLELPVQGWTQPSRIEFDLQRDDEELVFWSDLREGLQQRGNLAGGGVTRMHEAFAWLFEGAPEPPLDDLELWLDDMLVNLVLLGIPARNVAAAAGLEIVVAGDLVGGVTVSGSPYTPIAEGGFHWLEGRIGEVDLEGAFLSVTPLEDAYLVDLQLDFEGEGGLVAEGRIPVRVDLRTPLEQWTAGPLDIQVSGPGLPLQIASAFDPGIRSAAGLVVLEGQVRGTLSDPLPVVSASLERGAFIYSPLGLRFTEIILLVEADQRRISLSRLQARTEPLRRGAVATGLLDIAGESMVGAVGSARLEEWVPTALSGRFQLQNAWVAATQEAQLRMDGDVRVSGAWPALDVGGSLELRRGVMSFDAATFLAAAPLEPDRNLRIVRPGVVHTPRPPPEPPFYQDFNVNVALDLGRNLALDMGLPVVEDLGALGASVTRADVTARLGGENLQVTIAGGEPTLIGEVDVIDGRVRILRSRLDLQTGRIVFAGGPLDDPNLDLNARMVLPEGTVNMYIRGTVQEPDIEFLSEEYPDESQILAILLTGRAPETLSQEEAQGTAQALAGLLLDSLIGGQLLGGFSIGPDGSVEVGVPVTSQLFTTTRVHPGAGIGENRIALMVEWSIAPRLVLSAGLGDIRQWGDLFWEYRF